MKLMAKVAHIHHATASRLLNMNMPARMPDTFNRAENTPHMNRLFRIVGCLVDGAGGGQDDLYAYG